MPPVTRNILLACIAGYVLQLLGGNVVDDHLALWALGGTPPYAQPFEPWQLVSYAFLHGSFLHLAFNMFALYMFGSAIEQLLGPRRFLTYYMVCVVGGGVAQLLVWHAQGQNVAEVVGASGGIFGLLLAFGLAYPRRRILLLFPPIPMPAWLFVTLYGLLELYLGISGREGDVAHFAHLGGMVGGFALILYWRYQRR